MTVIIREQPPEPQRVLIAPASLGDGMARNDESSGTAPSSMAVQKMEPTHAISKIPTATADKQPLRWRVTIYSPKSKFPDYMARIPAQELEAAWQHRRPYARPGERLLRQLDLVTPGTRIRALEGNHRLHRKWEHFDERHKPSVKANTAIARELAGWCSSLAAPLQQGDRMNAA